MPNWITPENVDSWPNCKTPDCENKSCVSLDSEYCGPCTMRIRGLTLEEAHRQVKEAREKAFGVGCDD